MWDQALFPMAHDLPSSQDTISNVLAFTHSIYYAQRGFAPGFWPEDIITTAEGVLLRNPRSHVWCINQEALMYPARSLC